MSGCIRRLQALHSPVFLLNSCLDLFSAPQSPGGPLFRSYGASLPSSLTVNLSSLSVSSTRPPVSVCGTGPAGLMLSGFSREHASAHCRGAPGGFPYSPASARAVCLTAARIPLRFNALFRQRAALPLLRPRVAPCRGNGMLTVCPSSFASRLAVRARLTLIRLALIRNPWPSEGGVSRPTCRYLCLHLLFPRLHRVSRLGFCAGGMLPYRRCHKHRPTASAGGLMPDYYPRGAARLVSCYALFK